MKIALIVLDTLRKDKLSVYNSEIDYTNNIQQFAEDSEIYTNAVSQAPWSLPSQTTLLTGKYPWQHGATQKQPYIRKSTKTLPQKLPKDIEKAAIHNNTWLMPVTGAMKGFTHIDTPNNKTKYTRGIWRISNKSKILSKLAKKMLLKNSERNIKNLLDQETNSEDMIRKTKTFLDENAETDFFLYLNPLNAHYPYNPPQKYKEKHNTTETCLSLESRPSEYGGPVLDDEKEQVESLYEAEVDYLDDVFGKIIEEFKKQGIYEDTLIIVTSDHGEALGEEKTIGHHFSTQDELIEIPLLVKSPGNNENKDVEEITELREIHYKILNYAKVDEKDNEKLFPNKACGLYEEPVIYKERIPEEHQELSKPQFYIKDENETLRTSNITLEELSEKHEDIRNQPKVEENNTSYINSKIKTEGI